MWWLLVPAATFIGGLAVKRAARRILDERERSESPIPEEAPPPPPAQIPPPPPEQAAADPAAVTIPAPVLPPPERQVTVSDFAQRWVSPPLDALPAAPGKPAAAARPRPQGMGLAGYADLAFAVVSGLVFLGSFVWDWQQLLRTISVSGLIGWATNWVAIRMLFRPLEPRPILGQGLIPRKRREFFESISRAVVENQISAEIQHQEIERSGLVRRAAREQIDSLRTVLNSPEFRKDFHDLILTYVHRIVTSPEFRGRLRAFVEFRLNVGLENWTGRDMKGKMVEALKPLWKDQVRDEVLRNLEEVVREIPGTLPQLLDKLDSTIDQTPDYLEQQEGAITAVLTRAVTGFVRSLNVRDIVMARLNLLSNEYLERTVRNVTERQLDFITLAGGILGALGGFVIWNPYLVVVLPVVGLGVWGLDVALLARRKRDAPDPAAPVDRSAAPAPPGPASLR